MKFRHMLPKTSSGSPYYKYGYFKYGRRLLEVVQAGTGAFSTSKYLFFMTAFVSFVLIIQPTNALERTLSDAVTNWARLIGDEFMKTSELMRYRTAKENFQNVKMVYVDGNTLLHQKANEVRDLLYKRRDAVKKIQERAELFSNVSLPIGKEYPQPYDSVKKIELEDKDALEIPTYAPPVRSVPVDEWTNNVSAQFPGWVNTTVSGVQVPSDIYDGSMPPNLTEPVIQHGIWYSKHLEKAFIENFARDKEMSYQYFAHIKGFMRMFPAVRMGTENDYFDARFRPWFSKAATSNKNVVILLDNSGSMKGQNMLIARQVISNILDTLNPDDFVNIILFGQKTVNASIKCLEQKLVPATFLNIVELKRSLIKVKPGCPSNLEVGLKYAFNLLNQTREKRIGAMCNQAIMVVTDGPWMDTSIFGRHNEPFGIANKPVRVFTYQVGEDLRDAPGLKWIACQNQGWYLNVTVESAVRDRVATYIPVMARPWVMHNDHLIHWTHAYFHRRDTISVDLGWRQHERDTQKKRFITYRKYRKTPEELSLGKEDKPRFLVEDRARKEFNLSLAMNGTYLVISVSTPVYNKSVNLSSPYGELLGVAGVDIPIEEIRRIVPPHKAGVNNYFFMVNNNGFVVFHPDLRPTFFDTPKPTYASVDMSELEIDLSNFPGDTGGIELLRKQIVNKKNGTLVLMVEQPFDDMTRVETIKRRYHFAAIKETPYSLVFAVNDNIGPRDQTFQSGRADGLRVAEYFQGHWRTHPWWYYCRYAETALPVPDTNLLVAIKDWFWKGRVFCYSQIISHRQPDIGRLAKTEKLSSSDKELIDSLTEDASLTAWFPRQDQRNLVNNRRPLEPIVTFIATKSGLSRWVNPDSSKPTLPFERHFSVLHPRGPEEVWYRRAALHPDLTMVTSGPVFPTFSDDVNLEYQWQDINPDDMIITVSKAVVVDSHKSHRNIPAVVGMQLRQNTLQAVFNNITGNGWCSQKQCVPYCGSSDLECFLLDADSIIIAGSVDNSTGSPFGKWYPHVMRGLIDDGIFRVVRIRDNQAICLRPLSASRPLLLSTETWMSTSLALTVLTIATHFLPTSNSYHTVLSIAAATSLSSLVFATPTSDSIDSAYEYGYEQPGKVDLRKFLNKIRIPKSQPQSCTRQIDAMQLCLRQEPGPLPSYSPPHRQAHCPNRPYSAAYVPETNLLFVAVLINCSSSSVPEEDIVFDLSRVEINYNKSCLMAADLDLTRHRTRFHSCLSNHSNEALNKTECGLDHMVLVDASPPEPPILRFDYNFNCSKKKDAENEEF